MSKEQIKTPISYIYDAFHNLDKSEFETFLINNEQFLKEFEKQMIVTIIEDSKGGNGEDDSKRYIGKDAWIFLKTPFNLALKYTHRKL